MKKGSLFSWVRIFLFPFAFLYGIIVWLRNRLYDAKFYSSVSFSVPTISVGNLSTGGTGKTPHVEYLIRLLLYQFKIGTISRGYKRSTQGFMIANETANALRIGDEPMQYHIKFPDVVVSVGEDRMTGIPQLLMNHHDIDVVLMDDAFQHRSVQPGLNILITDYAKPYYSDHILPYGTLREGHSSAHRADIIIVSKCPPLLSLSDSLTIKQRISPLPHQSVYFSSIHYLAPYDIFTREPFTLHQKNVVLVCCIAKPQTLITQLQATNLDVHPLTYADHHYFYSRDLLEIKAAYDNWEVPDKVIVTTEKDAVRLLLLDDKIREWNIPIIVLPIQVAFLFDGGQSFDKNILKYVEEGSADYRNEQ